MWIRRRKWWLLFLLSALLFVAYAWFSAVIWYSSEIRARVVTPDGRPVASAIVTANWALEYWIHGTSMGQLQVVEVVTDKNGEFRIPPWGPLFLPPSFGGYKRATIRIFAPNFIPLVANDFDQEKSLNPGDISRESLRKEALVLKPFQGPLTQYENELAYVAESLSFVQYGGDTCAWKKIPRITIALHRVKTALLQEGKGQVFKDFYLQALATNSALCGDANEFFRDYLKNE